MMFSLNYATCHSYIGGIPFRNYVVALVKRERVPSTAVYSKMDGCGCPLNPKPMSTMSSQSIRRFQKRLLGVGFGTCEIQLQRDSSASLPFLLGLISCDCIMHHEGVRAKSQEP